MINLKYYYMTMGCAADVLEECRDRMTYEGEVFRLQRQAASQTHPRGRWGNTAQCHKD
jgi:hypothetical protein